MSCTAMPASRPSGMRLFPEELLRVFPLDPVSYLRFASVYKGFDDLADFEAEVVELQKLSLQKTTAPKTPEPDQVSPGA